jgi:DNA-directed RNA polymerase specialized sigma24 family protein
VPQTSHTPLSATIEPRWSLTQTALAGLLQHLGSDADAAGRGYERLRYRLIGFFTLRRFESPESLADETLDRVARKIEEGEAVAHLRGYAYGVARRIALERAKRQERERRALRDRLPLLAASPAEPVEIRSTCLARCLDRLAPEARALLHRYYHPEGRPLGEHRQRLADELGISAINLRVRAHRLRAQLHGCLGRCLEAETARIALCARKIRSRARPVPPPVPN